MNLCHRVTSNTDKVSSPPNYPHLSLDDFYFPDHVLVENMIREILVFTASLAAANINCECDCPIPELPKTGDYAVSFRFFPTFLQSVPPQQCWPSMDPVAMRLSGLL